MLLLDKKTPEKWRNTIDIVDLNTMEDDIQFIVKFCLGTLLDMQTDSIALCSQWS